MSNEHTLKAIAIEALQGVGDASLGEWQEWSGRAYHIRRRLTEQEELLVGPAVDIRGTDEALERARKAVRQGGTRPHHVQLAEMELERPLFQ